MKKSISLADFPEISRVTGQLDDEGMPGLHGHAGDLDWHCNKVSAPNRKPIVYLYSLVGSAGSRTSWINSVLAYKELPQNLKDRIENLQIKVSRSFDNYSDLGRIYKLNDPLKESTDYFPKIVQKNAKGHLTLYFSFNQMTDFKDIPLDESKELTELLKAHLLQEKFMYHHDWRDGDVVISDQWSGIHKRWAFDKMENRLLHRIAMDYTKIKFIDA
jgi:alpha-ketoglutarate-dependent taurine dioxygenase